MIQHPSCILEPWRIREDHLDLEVLAQTESIFALSNGHLGLRGNLDEGEPFGLPGTYLGSVYELRPLPYGESGYGYPESGQSIINVTNGKLIRLLIDDEPFDVRYGQVRSHERILDLRAGMLTREVHWTSPAGQDVVITSERLVSFTQRAIAAIRYVVSPIGGPARVVVQSELVTNEPLPNPGRDPRAAAALEAPLTLETQHAHDGDAIMVHRTKRSGLRVAAAMDHVHAGPDDTDVETELLEDTARITFSTALQPGETLCVVKFLAYGWSGIRSRAALRDQVAAALTAARQTGWSGLVAEQRQYLDAFWDHSDVEVAGDPEMQHAVRFGLFHVLQAGARAERRPIAAKGLTGTGYDGHAFWDTEMFVLPVLTYTQPDAAADALRWRHSTLGAAKDRALALGLRGATFPWRTIGGEECSGYWPAGTAAFHVNADIAAAVVRYMDATEDVAFEQEVGLELLAETARLWMALGHHDRDGRYRIDGVTGPDEYSALADNNVYTNLMAEQNLRAAADAAERHPDRAAHLGITGDEIAAWRSAAATMYIPYDDHLGVHPQADGFTTHQVWNFAATPPDNYPLLLHYPYVDLYRKQVVKQADLVLALHVRGDAFTDDQRARDFAYYERLTVRDSSLSAATQAVVAAETGHLDLAYDYLAEAALVDIRDLQHNTRDGIHMAAVAGAWIALVEGFGGLRARNATLCFAPHVPHGIERLTFNLLYRKRRLRVTVQPAAATYELRSGDPLEIYHDGQALYLDGREPVTRPVSQLPPLEPPLQPPGREPPPRHSRS